MLPARYDDDDDDDGDKKPCFIRCAFLNRCGANKPT